ncbi:MAG: helix-turn-helix domain-containing protein, partial [Chloroflexi bacterium]|nr:helix-turn-helix domain-containing protein [Chloroflexota bacterium]
ILRLAEVLDADRDELMTLAGKIPSDIAQMLKNSENWQSLRSGGIRKMVRPVNNIESFNSRLKELREQAGLSQRELADKVGVNFSYLSKIESGAMPAPSERVILRLAEVLDADRDELMTLAGKIPSDIIQMLKSGKNWQSLRSGDIQRKVRTASEKGGINMGGVSMRKYLGRYKRLSRVALAIVLVGAMAVSLWFTSPSPVKALNIAITAPQGQPLINGTLGQTYNFQVTVTIENDELVPIDHIDLNIFNAANPALKANLVNVPLVGGVTKPYTAGQTGGGAANVSVASLNFGWKSGYGYVVWQGYAYHYFTVPGGYGPLTGTGPASITYNVAWTPPTGWPTGNYKIGSGITVATNTFSQVSNNFALMVGLIAETSVAQSVNATSGAVMVKVNIDRIKDPTTGNTATMPGGIGSYTAKASSNGNTQFLAVNGVSPFNNPSYDTNTGIFSVATVANPPQASNTTIANVVAILTGNTTTSVNLSIALQTIGAAGEPGLFVTGEQANTIVLLRGDADKSGAISVTDSLAIKQYLVGQLTLSQINPLDAATPNHDGSGGDKITVTDALAIEQFLVQQLNAYYQ